MTEDRFSQLIAWLAVVSIISWSIVAFTAIMRFASRLLYSRRELFVRQKEKSLAK